MHKVFLKKILFTYLFDFKEGEEREKERERHISWLPLACSQMGTWPTTQACALTWNQTSDLLDRSTHWATRARERGFSVFDVLAPIFCQVYKLWEWACISDCNFIFLTPLFFMAVYWYTISWRKDLDIYYELKERKLQKTINYQRLTIRSKY